MVARTTPTVVMKPGPPKPEDDTERLRQLQDAVLRHSNGLAKAIAGMAVLEAKRQIAT
jgi:hypothetical protein